MAVIDDDALVYRALISPTDRGGSTHLAQYSSPGVGGGVNGRGGGGAVEIELKLNRKQN